MYFADLTPYTYCGSLVDPNVVNVGWLDKSEPFATGQILPEALQRLEIYCGHPVNVMRGGHSCPFCENKPMIDPATYCELPMVAAYAQDGSLVPFSCAEIRVFGKSPTIYAAPTLIKHYVEEHKYRPPDEFLDALLRDPVRFWEDTAVY